LFNLAEVHQMRRETHAAQQQVEASLALCAEYGFEFFRVRGTILHGWTLAMHGDGERGMAQIHQSLAAYQASGAESSRPYHALLLADVYGKVGDSAAGLAAMDEALASIESTQERWWAAEIHRCKGELLLQAGKKLPGKSQRHIWWKAEQSFCQALDIARRQQARSLELRAAVYLSRLWQQHGQRAKARQLLAEVYDWFTEGFDTTGLQEAQALLAELS
jgi:adenylate cyclase